MNMDELIRRQQYIKNQNDLNKAVKVEDYVNANKKKVDLDKKLEELSYSNSNLVSGSVIRQNVLKSSASTQTTLSNTVDTEVYLEGSTSSNIRQDNLAFNMNKGRETLKNMNNLNNNSFKKF